MTEAVFVNEILKFKQEQVQHFPDQQKVHWLIDGLFALLFVRQEEESNPAKALEQYGQLKNTLASLIREQGVEEGVAQTQTANFFYVLPDIYKALLKDADAILKSDPAAKSLSEVLLAYPGFFATAVYRLSHQIWLQELPTLARVFCEYAHSKTGIDIHPAAEIGEAFAIDHGTGVVIGETTVIGDHVKIYQGVTLGALSVDKSCASIKRHPTIEDEVVIYSGATILGGETVIGRGSIIGGNVFLTYSIPSQSVVYHKSEIKVKDRHSFPEPINFVI